MPLKTPMKTIFALDTDADAKDDAVQAFDKDVGVVFVFYPDAVPNDDATCL